MSNNVKHTAEYLLNNGINANVYEMLSSGGFLNDFMIFLEKYTNNAIVSAYAYDLKDIEWFCASIKNIKVIDANDFCFENQIETLMDIIKKMEEPGENLCAEFIGEHCLSFAKAKTGKEIAQIYAETHNALTFLGSLDYYLMVESMAFASESKILIVEI